MIALLVGTGAAFVLCIFSTPALIRVLRARGIGQQIRDDGPFAHVFGGDQAGLADRDHEHIGAPRVRNQIARGDVTEGNGGHLLGQQQRDWFAGNLRCPNDDGFSAAKVKAG